MNLKDILKKNFSNEKNLILKKFKSAKFLFAIIWLLFFMNYFLVSNLPEDNYFILFLPSLYVAFVFSYVLLAYFWVKKKYLWKINNWLLFVFLLILIIIWTIFTLPFLVDNEIIKNLF
jgi:hypothetical protein